MDLLQQIYLNIINYGGQIPIKNECIFNGTISSKNNNYLLYHGHLRYNVFQQPIINIISQFSQISTFQNFMDQQPKSVASSLPIYEHKQQIIQLIKSSHTTVICGETGCGKTTQVPQYLYPYYGTVLVTQPRRISAITLAERVCYEMGYELGNQIGYSVRFQQKRSSKTKVVFMTDGMAIRELMTGKMFDVFVIDQAHQRSINTDVLMALLKQKMKKNNKIKNSSNSPKNKYMQREKPFKIVIMSATIQSSKFLDFFQSDSIVRVKGRTYPTQIYNLMEPVQNYMEATFNTIMQVHCNEPKGDILAFLTGQDEILSLSKRIAKTVQEYKIYNLQVLMLYSALPHQYQHSIFTPHQQSKRRVILATNIAETSITINGLRYVIDPGFMKIRVYDSLKNIDMLTVVPISKANSLQRAGRAGREASGKCFRLYIKNDYEQLKDQIVPEILRSQLTGPILQLKAIGVPKIAELQFMDQPPQQTFTNCLALLKTLKCLTQSQVITPYGLQVSKIPLTPYLSSLLIQSYEQKCHHIMLNVLSILSIDNLFYVSKDNRNKNNCVLEVMKKYMPILGGTHLHSDHLAKANVLEQYIESTNKKNFCKGNYVNKNNIKRAVLIRDQLRDYLKQIINERQKKQFHSIAKSHQITTNKKQDKFRLTPQSISSWLKCMENGSPNNVAKLNKQGNYTIISSDQIASIHPQSLLFFVKSKPQFVVFYQVVRTTKLYLRDVSGLPSNK